MIKLEALVREGTKLILRSIYINPAFIVSIVEEELMTKDLRCEQMSQKFPEGLNREHALSEIVYAEANHSKRLVVIGSPDSIYSKIFSNNTKTLLRG